MSKKISEKVVELLEFIKKEEEYREKEQVEHSHMFELIKKMSDDIEDIKKAVC